MDIFDEEKLDEFTEDVDDDFENLIKIIKRKRLLFYGIHAIADDSGELITSSDAIKILKSINEGIMVEADVDEIRIVGSDFDNLYLVFLP